MRIHFYNPSYCCQHPRRIGNLASDINVSGEESSGRVDYAIKKILDDLLEEIICITEGKQNQPGKGVAQNLMQCRSSCEVSNTFFMSSLHFYQNILTNPHL